MTTQYSLLKGWCAANLNASSNDDTTVISDSLLGQEEHPKREQNRAYDHIVNNKVQWSDNKRRWKLKV